MRLRPYRQSDAEGIGCWIEDALTHANWCANILPYPFDAQAFETNRKEGERKWANSCFTAADDSGRQIGYFHMGMDHIENAAFLGFVIVDRRMRGKGHGLQMIKLAIRYAFELADVEKVKLMVFDRNEPAIKCYIKAGFAITEHIENCFVFQDRTWGKYVMEIFRERIHSTEKKCLQMQAEP